MQIRRSVLFLLLSSAAAYPAHAQETGIEAQPQEEEGSTGGAGAAEVEDPAAEEAIVITGTRLRGSVIGDIAPELTLDARDIRSYGASNIAELLDQLTPQTTSGRGREGGQPVTLVNGRRISSFAEIRDIPPEAIERVEVLPEEVALKYGYRADQRVVNFVLRERFRQVTAELEGGIATAGGRETFEIDTNLLRINGNGRTILDLEYTRQGALLESERDIIQATSNNPFDLTGNIGSAMPRGANGLDPEIDPALSALAGQRVTVAAVPSSAASGIPTLGSFAAGANAANVTDLGDFRTLSSPSDRFAANGAVSRTIFGDVSASINARYEYSDSTSLLGLPSRALALPGANPFSPFNTDTILYRYFDAFGPLERDRTSHTGRVGVAMNGDMLPWRWSFTGSYQRTGSTTLTDRDIDIGTVQTRISANDPSLNPFGDLDSLIAPGQRDRAFSVSDTASAELVFNGPLATLPAGEITTSVRGGYNRLGVRSETRRGITLTEREVTQSRGNLQANLDLPIASRRDDVLAAIGNLSANVNAEVEELSSYGTLTTFGGGLNWEPIEQLRLIASFTKEEGAPTINQLGDPVIVTPNVRTFDFVRGETVDISRTDGGNPNLLADDRRVINLSATVKPIEEEDLTITANYVITRVNNVIASFPAATAEIEAAFPERFVRDVSGRLVSIDNRPVNFERSDRKQLRWGINYSKSIGQPTGGNRPGQGGNPGAPGAGPAGNTPPGATPPAGAAPGSQGQPATVGQQAQGGAPRGPGASGRAPGSGRGPGGFGRGGFGGGQRGVGRLNVSLYHTWRLQDEILIREGVPVLDLLDGSATGGRGGQSAHQIELQGGFFKNGFGGRLSANWQSSTFVRGVNNGLSQSSDLFFSDFYTVDLRLFADLGNQPALRSQRWLRGTRVSLNIDNLFDNRLDVRDAAGINPINYQPDLLDPIGRSITLSIRKAF